MLHNIKCFGEVHHHCVDLFSIADELEVIPTANKIRLAKLPYFEGDHWPRVIENVLAPKTKFKSKKVRQELFEEMNKVHAAFFVIKLMTTVSKKTTCIQDPDEKIHSHLMRNRTVFMQFTKDRNLEFSTLQGNQEATKAFLYELHNDKFHCCSHVCLVN